MFKLSELSAREGIARTTEALIAFDRGECEDLLPELADLIEAVSKPENDIDLEDAPEGSLFALMFDPAFIGTTMKLFKLMNEDLYRSYLIFLRSGGLVNLFAVMGARLEQMESHNSNIIRDLMSMDDADEPDKKDK